MASRPLSAALALVAGAAALVVPATTAEASAPGTKDVTAVLFEWKFDSVAKACTDTLGPAGYGFVQVSPPPQEHIQAASGGPRTSRSATRSPGGSATVRPSPTWSAPATARA